MRNKRMQKFSELRPATTVIPATVGRPATKGQGGGGAQATAGISNGRA
jgi:hypothetical protein